MNELVILLIGLLVIVAIWAYRLSKKNLGQAAAPPTPDAGAEATKTDEARLSRQWRRYGNWDNFRSILGAFIILVGGLLFLALISGGR